MSAVDLFAFGESAWRIALPRPPTRALLERVRSLALVRDVVLSEMHLCMHFESPSVRAQFAEESSTQLAAWLTESFSETEGTQSHEFATRYDGEDLHEVARQLGLTQAEVVQLHTANEYTVKSLGFLPGFAYLGDVAQKLRVPRKSTPRTRVPAGAVAIADARTGVYPFAGPGGWNLLGTLLNQSLFDPRSGALLALGDRVRFVAESAAPDPALVAATMAPHELTRDAVLVLERCEGVVLLQDQGRFGWMHQGVSCGGPIWPSLATNVWKITGQTAVLECYGAITVRAERADLWLCHNGTNVLLRAGESVRFERFAHSSVGYLGVHGTVLLERQLGSVSQFLRASLGGIEGARSRPLRSGDVLPIRKGVIEVAPALAMATTHDLALQLQSDHKLRVMPGPDVARFAPSAIDQLLATPWKISVKSDRTGIRLEPVSGVGLPRLDADLGKSAPMVAGAMQVPADGMPIVLGADHPTTGGYPVLVVLTRESLGALAARKPQSIVQFSVDP